MFFSVHEWTKNTTGRILSHVTYLDHLDLLLCKVSDSSVDEVTVGPWCLVPTYTEEFTHSY